MCSCPYSVLMAGGNLLHCRSEMYLQLTATCVAWWRQTTLARETSVVALLLWPTTLADPQAVLRRTRT